MYYNTQAKTVVKKVIQFEFISFENLIFFAKRIYGLCKRQLIESDLYKADTKYIVILRAKPVFTKSILKFCPLTDNCTLSAVDISVTLEHAKLLTKSNAIEKINDSF